MRTKKTFFLFSLVLLLFNACVVETTVKPSPVANFAANTRTINMGESISFTDLSTNGPTEWNWQFEGGDPNFSAQQNPIVRYTQPGTYQVALAVSNNSGSDSKVQYGYINVIKPELILTLYNDLPTELTVTVEGIKRVIAPGESFNYTGFDPYSNTSISAYTSGYKLDNTTVGNILTWDIPISFGTTNQDAGFSTASGTFFLYIQNIGADLYGLYVNKGLVAETYDEILIRGDSKVYGIGYYDAFENGNVYAFFNDGSGQNVYWVHNHEYTFSWIENEYIQLVNDKFKKKQSNVSTVVPTPISKSANLIPRFAPKKTSTLPAHVKMYPNTGKK